MKINRLLIVGIVLLIPLLGLSAMADAGGSIAWVVNDSAAKNNTYQDYSWTTFGITTPTVVIYNPNSVEVWNETVDPSGSSTVWINARGLWTAVLLNDGMNFVNDDFTTMTEQYTFTSTWDNDTGIVGNEQGIYYVDTASYGDICYVLIYSPSGVSNSAVVPCMASGAASYTPGAAGIWNTTFGAWYNDLGTTIEGAKDDITITGCDGNLLWLHPTGVVDTTPVSAGSNIYFESYDGYFYALDATTSAEVWNFTAGSISTSSPVISGGNIYFGADKFYALNVVTGAEVWNFTTTAMVASSPSVGDGNVYFGDISGSFYAADATTGAQAWMNGSFSAGIFGGTAYANGIVYFASADGNFYAFDGVNGVEIWNFIDPYTISSKAPLVSNGVVYYGDDNGLFALNAATGSEIWNYPIGAPVNGKPAISNGVLYFGAADNKMYAVDASTGIELWNYTAGGSIFSSPAIGNGNVYFGCADNNLYAVNLTTHALSWTYSTNFAVHSPLVIGDTIYVGNGFYGADGLFAIEDTCMGPIPTPTPTPTPTTTIPIPTPTSGCTSNINAWTRCKVNDIGSLIYLAVLLSMAAVILYTVWMFIQSRE